MRSCSWRLPVGIVVAVLLTTAVLATVGCPQSTPQPVSRESGSTAEAVPISVSVIDETASGQRRLKVRVTWSARYSNDPLVRLQYDVYRDAASPPFTHLKPQEVVALADAVHWQVMEKDVQVDTSGAQPAWDFHVPLQQTWPITPPWNGHVRVRVSAFVEASDGTWRGALGTSTTAIVPQEESGGAAP